MDENVKNENANNSEAEYEEVKENASDVNSPKKECCRKNCRNGNNEMTVFVLGLLGLLLPLWNPVFSIVGFILAIIAVVKGHKAKKAECTTGLLTAGYVMGIIALVIAGATLVFGLSFAVRFITPYHYFYRTFWF